jgi:hypothetical protein
MKITSLSKILLISGIIILLLGATLIYYLSISVTKTTKTITVTETKTITTTIFLDTDGDGIPNYKEKEYGTDPNKPNYLLAYALKKLPENEALKFKNVENFNESSKGLVDLYSSLPENIRNSKGVDELLNQILSDNIINELEKNLFYDKFVLPSLPLIFNLEWFPTRVILDKIYDINVTFVAKDDDTPIAYAELHFIPIEYHYMIEKYGMRQEDYSKVFPPDKERVYVLTPIDGKFDSLEERFSVSINDIVGGRGYKIVVLIRDLAGNERKTEIKTPYIRQFENIAKTDDITVAAFYYNWYTLGYDIPKDLPDKPLLGLYYSNDNVVFNKHIDWATGHGIDVFVFPYPYPQPTKAFDWLERTFRKNMEADLFNQIKFSFISTFVDNTAPQPPYNFDDPKVKEEFINSINYIKIHYAKLPNFWKIDGKPVIVTWSTHAYQSKEGNIKDAFEKVGSNKDVYIIGEIASNLAIDKKFYPFLEAPIYGIYNYQPALAPFHPWEMNSWPKMVNLSQILGDILSIMDGWSKFAESLHTKYIPTVSPGNDKTYDYRDTNRPPIVIGDPQVFQEFVRNVRERYLDKEQIKIIFVTSFNEWFEQTQLEPAHGYGFEYLEALYKGLNESIKEIKIKLDGIYA